ncbi:MAG: glycoside hydrolase family 43 C-terminal domain-containing protein [Agathobacter rectalis]
MDGKKYSGVFCQMKDEAGSDVMTFSAVGENKSVWGVKYL